METIKLALADDERLFAEGLRRILSVEADLQVIHLAADGSELLEQLESSEAYPDVFLLDLRMKPLDGLGTMEALKKKDPEVRVIVLSTHYQESFLGYMVKLGVSAFLPKDVDPDHLVRVIRKVHEQGLFLSEENVGAIRDQLISGKRFETPSWQQQEKLTKRENEVLKLICDQYTNAEIAEKLFLSIRTVEGHRNNLLAKTGAKNTVGLVMYALLNGIVNVEEKLLEYSF